MVIIHKRFEYNKENFHFYYSKINGKWDTIGDNDIRYIVILYRISYMGYNDVRAKSRTVECKVRCLQHLFKKFLGLFFFIENVVGTVNNLMTLKQPKIAIDL